MQISRRRREETRTCFTRREVLKSRSRARCRSSTASLPLIARDVCDTSGKQRDLPPLDKMRLAVEAKKKKETLSPSLTRSPIFPGEVKIKRRKKNEQEQKPPLFVPFDLDFSPRLLLFFLFSTYGAAIITRVARARSQRVYEPREKW